MPLSSSILPPSSLIQERVCVDCGCAVVALLGLCGDCAQARYERGQAVRRMAEQKVRENRWLRICPPRYRDTEWARPGLCPVLAEVAQTWRPGAGGRPSLMLAGPTGLGKTRAAFAILHRYHESRRSVQALHAGDAWDAGEHVQSLSSAVRLQYSDHPRLVQAAVDCLQRARTCGLLLLDDLGKERADRQTGCLSEAVGEALFGLIEHRLIQQLPMVITTNLSGCALQDRLGRDRGMALMRRLFEDSEVVG